MSKYQSVEGHPGLVRDKRSGAILNINETEIKNALLRKQRKKEEANKVSRMESEISSLKNDISDIKSLLLKMIEEKDGINNN